MDKTTRIIKVLVLFSLIYSCFNLKNNNIVELNIKKNIIPIEKVFYLENGDKVKLLSKDDLKTITLFFKNDKEINLTKSKNEIFLNKKKNVDFVFDEKGAKLNLDTKKHILSSKPIVYVKYESIAGIEFSIADINGEKSLKVNNQIDTLYKKDNYYENEAKTIKLIVEDNKEFLEIKGIKNKIELIRK
ncbi:hypothetical protein [Oceanivirga miroungae]|uniref:Lipoprotein n=1 Tax=Oceanivirga miroungae TaxID=1130046 RepID=A0A6I8ME62_9FUSO|nr:hypothetical protein [Oceanivirga miroungae]VWL85755.1 hypothetical protein OMES3154_01043 [Oceanivirga miroungae]